MKTYCDACHFELKETEHQYCAPCKESLEDYITFQHQQWQKERAEARPRFRDYEPEQAYGTHHDFEEHTRYGGTRENY